MEEQKFPKCLLMLYCYFVSLKQKCFFAKIQTNVVPSLVDAMQECMELREGEDKAEMSYKFALDSFLFNISANPALKFRIILENATPPIKCKNIAKKSCNSSCEPVVKY